MTVQDILTEVYENIGEPSDLLPYTTPGDSSTFDITLAGSQRLLKWLNRASQVVSNWKFRDGRILRFRNLFTNTFFQTYVYTGTLTGGTSTTVVLPATASPVDDTYKGWVVEITDGTGEGQKRFLIAYDGDTLTGTVHSEWDTTPDSTSVVSLYKNFEKFVLSTETDAALHIPLSATSEMCTILKVRDLENQQDLVPRERGQFFTANLVESGIPTTYWEYGNSLYFELAVDEVRSYEIKYVKYPEVLSTAAQVPEIPIPFHEALSMWCTWNGHKRNRDSQLAYSVKRDLIDFMETMREARDLRMEMEYGYLVLGD